MLYVGRLGDTCSLDAHDCSVGVKVRLSQGKEGKCPSYALDNRLDEVSLEWQRRAGTYSSAASTGRVLGNGGALGTAAASGECAVQPV